MKILMLGWELPPYNSGGMGVACLQLCRKLSEHGAAIEFVVPYRAEHDIDFMTIHSATSYTPEQLQMYGGIYTSKYFTETGEAQNLEYSDLHGQVLAYEQAIDDIIKITEFDVIHAHDWLTFRAAIRAKQISGKPLIVHVHATEFDRAAGNSGNPIVHDIEYLGLLMADKIVAVSEYTKSLIHKHYQIPLDKIDVVHNGIEYLEMTPCDGNNAYAYLSDFKRRGYSVVSSICRLTVMKGLTNLLLAMHEVVKYEPKTILLLVGAGEQKHELIRMSAELGLAKNVLFVDFQRGKRWRDAYDISDIFIMPSITEPFGLTALEAVFYGASVLISRQSGVSEVLKNCLKFDCWDINLMANQIVGALRNQELRSEMSNNASQELPTLDWTKGAHKLVSLYQAFAEPGVMA